MSRMFPLLMVRNEERWIGHVVQPLLDVFGGALVGDTGSTDRTLAIVSALPGVVVRELGPLDKAALGQARAELGEIVRGMGHEWALMVDGDELYNRATLAAIRDEGMPEGKGAGFVTMLSLDEDEATGALFEMADLFNRLAVFPAGGAWTGVYPFEAPAVFRQPAGFHYFALPAGHRYHALHLHRLRRSAADADVMMRVQKQKQFCLAERPEIQRTVPFDLGAWETS